MTPDFDAGARPTDRLLVVDDNPRNVALLEAQLKHEAYAVTTALSGRAALESVAADPPDLVLLDVMMPGLDGYEVCRQLRASDAGRAIPILILTSLQERADKLRALEAGADDFLTKPVDRAELIARVRSLLRSHRLYRDLQESRNHVSEQARQLAEEKSRAEAVLYSIGDSVLTTDVEERITLLNPAAEVMFGETLERVQGQRWTDAFAVRDPSGQALGAHNFPVSRALHANKAVGPAEVTLWRADGLEIGLSISAAPIRRGGGAVVGAVIVCRDVTRQREVDNLKREFIALVSHELRTPMASMFGFAELLLQRETLSDNGKLYARTIYQETERLLNLVTDFLDIERLGSGHITFHPRVLNVAELLAEVAIGLSPQLAKHNLVIDLPQETLSVFADHDRLKQVLFNLISNAIKYTPAGGDIRVSGRGEGSEATLSVQDSGLGIPPEAVGQLFTRFYRVQSQEHRAIGGTGLGLAICRQIVEGRGGRIWVESPGLGQGSTFSFTVPVATSRHATTQANVATA